MKTLAQNLRSALPLFTLLLAPVLARGDGIAWPTNQLLPTFAAPAAAIDCIDVSSASDAEADLFASLEGIVNRTQPRIACVSSGDGEGKTTWLDQHNLSYSMVSGYTAVVKYKTNVAGLVVTDPNQPDTLNLATTMAGVSNLLICDPSLLATLTNSPYSLPVSQDLRGRFANTYQVYGFLYTNYWPQCTHRMFSGLYTNLHGNLRDYLVAVKAATVWLNPATTADKNLLAQFASGWSAMNCIYTGWWPSEPDGLNWIAQYGIPVLASDWFRNGSLFSGIPHTVCPPAIPPPPPLQNKVYVALILSDGDNIQYVQHVMRMDWGLTARGTFPLGWTVTPLAAEMDPAMFNYYCSTATANDCLISGPSGAGYTHMQNWNSANLAAYTKASRPYLERAGLRVITVWEQVPASVARSFASNCPALLGLTDQSGGTYTTVNNGLRTLGLTVTYSSSTNDIIAGITNAAQSWNGTAPMFLAAQANVWSLGPAQLQTIAKSLDPNKYVVVRPDHLFLLYNSVFGYPAAVTKAAVRISPTGAFLQGFVLPNATNAVAWMEWGTNETYGAATATQSVSGTALAPVSLGISGLASRTIYHYRAVASNALGVAYGADRTFTAGNHVKAWGDGSLGQTNVPPGLANAVGVSCGANHGLALKNDGSVVAWGDNSYGQTNVPAGLGSVFEVAGGTQHSLALKADGTVAAWGDNSQGQTNVPAALTNVVAIAAGAFHNLALKADGSVVAWGDNSSGQTNVPAGLSNVVDIVAGATHSLALKADGTVIAWGGNLYGQTNVPAGLSNVVALAAGQNHSLALKADGLASTNLLPAARWLADSLSGADGTAIASWPDIVAGKNAAQATSANRPRLYSNTMNGHKVVRFAASSSQYLTVSAADSPLSAAGSFTLIVVFKTSTLGSASTYFYFNTGLLGAEQPNIVPDWALCLNGSQLGAGLGGGANGCGADLSLYGGNVTDGTPHIAMYVRAGDTITLYVDGAKVAAQGSLCPMARGNYPFQIGAMTSSSYFFNGDIAEIQLFDRALSALEVLGANEALSAAYAINGLARTAVAWGSNVSGQTNGPASLTNLAAVAGGNAFSLALQENGTVIGWGANGSGQTNLPAGLTNVAAIAAGGSFGLALGNQPPQVTNITVSGYANHNLTVALAAANPDGNPLSFRLLTLPQAGTLYQYANGFPGSPFNVSYLTVTDASGRVIFAPANNQIGSPYTAFAFVATDGFYTSAAGQVQLNIGLPAPAQLSGPVQVAGNPNQWQVNFAGAPNATYSLWASTNLLNWERLGTANEAAPGQYQFIEAPAIGCPQRFYRATAP